MLLETVGLRKVVGDGTVDGIDLDIDARELFGLFDPKGAGRSTLVGRLVGLIGPSSGSIRIAGDDVVDRPRLAKQACTRAALVRS